MSAWATGVPEATPTGLGITGGALLGGELVTAVEAAADVKPAWAYIVGGLGGAAGGGVGGYFLEQSASAKTNMFLFTGGLLLAIPTTVAVLNARAYEPPTGDIQDRGPADEPVAEPPRAQSKGSSHARRAHSQRQVAAVVPPALVAVGDEVVSLSVPAVGLSPVFTRSELDQFGVAQRAQWNLPVLNWFF
ncbi:MAG: hypothetical protein SFV15_17975 [Polyangiaceae bacterium]|nr:hypothetical protein [Polyangiaceae bacterium]